MNQLIQFPHRVNLVNAMVLIGAGLFGFIARYLDVGDFQPTALIPAMFGVILLIMTNGIKSGNKIIAHIAVLVTLLVIVMVGSMLSKALGSDEINLRRVLIFSLIVVTGIVSLIFYILGFIEKRKQKA